MEAWDMAYMAYGAGLVAERGALLVASAHKPITQILNIRMST